MKTTQTKNPVVEPRQLTYRDLEDGEPFTMFLDDTPRARTASGHVAFQQDGRVVTYRDSSFLNDRVIRIDAELVWCRR